MPAAAVAVPAGPGGEHRACGDGCCRAEKGGRGSGGRRWLQRLPEAATAGKRLQEWEELVQQLPRGSCRRTSGGWWQHAPPVSRR